MTNHGLDQFVVAVGSGLRIGQNIFGVEQVKALVLHGTGVKVGHGDDHEALQIQLQAKPLFVPEDGAFEALKREVSPANVLGLCIDLQ